jgi:hypothetical protein
MAETRSATLEACRHALREHVGHFLEVKDQLFIVNGIAVRPKGTGTAEGDWVWDMSTDADTLVPVREGFYILHDVNVPTDFYIVPTDVVRGALEGAHFQWYIDGFTEDQLDGAVVNERSLEKNTMRRLRKWPVRHYRNAWHLLKRVDESMPHDLDRARLQTHAVLRSRGYKACTIAKCHRLIKDMDKHVKAHASGLLDENGKRTDR